MSNRLAADGPTRDCTCPVANHVHGTRVAYVVDRCRCRPCRDAAAAAERHRIRMKAYGRWEPYVDAEPARAHVRELSEAGMGWKRVAECAGIQSSTVWKLMYGRNGVPSKRVRRETAAKLLAVRLDLAAGAHVDATGTRRRLQALVAIGWSQTRLAEQLGWNVGNINSLILGRDCPCVQHDTATRVRAMYDRLWNTLPLAANRFEQAGITRAKNVAVKRGWPPPLAWDDETIDDPAATPATPETDASTARGRSRDSVAGDVQWLLELDSWATRRQVAERLGMTLRALEFALERSGREDLRQQLTRNAQVAS